MSYQWFTSLRCPLHSYSSTENGQDFKIWKQKQFMWVFIHWGFVLDPFQKEKKNSKFLRCTKEKGRWETILREQGNRCNWTLERHPSPWLSCDYNSEIFSSQRSISLQFLIHQQRADMFLCRDEFALGMKPKWICHKVISCTIYWWVCGEKIEGILTVWRHPLDNHNEQRVPPCF